MTVSYFSPFPKAQRKFNASHLNSARCTEKHFTVRLVQKNVAEEDIVWSSVIGLGERFFLYELLSFPIWVLANHGDSWNNLGWTYWVILFFGAPLTILCVRLTMKAFNREPLELILFRDRKIIFYFDDWREVLYELGILGFTAAGLEMFVHLCLATQGVTDTQGYAVGLGVAIVPNLLGILLCVFNWSAIRLRGQIKGNEAWSKSNLRRKRCTHCCFSCSSSA